MRRIAWMALASLLVMCPRLARPEDGVARAPARVTSAAPAGRFDGVPVPRRDDAWLFGGELRAGAAVDGLALGVAGQVRQGALLLGLSGDLEGVPGELFCGGPCVSPHERATAAGRAGYVRHVRPFPAGLPVRLEAAAELGVMRSWFLSCPDGTGADTCRTLADVSPFVGARLAAAIPADPFYLGVAAFARAPLGAERSVDTLDGRKRLRYPYAGVVLSLGLEFELSRR